MSLTQARLKELLRYNRKTGEFFWRVSWGRGGFISGGARCGKRAGSIDKNGYLVIRADRVLYGAHRLAWLYWHGKFPDKELDHKNRNRLDNRIANLRKSTRKQNSANSTMHKDNRSGFKGVYKVAKKYVAQISKDGKWMYLGYFNRPEEAHAAYCRAAKKLHGEFSSPG